MTTIVLGLRLLLAVVFLAAGIGKLLDLEGSRRAVRDFGVPEGAAKFAGAALPVLELLVAVALVFVPTARWGALAALLLLAAFIVGIGRALARGEQPDCHCFGQIHSEPAGPLTLVRNAVLAACAAAILAYGSGPAIDTWINDHSAAVLVAVALGICAAIAVVYALSLRGDVRRLGRDLETARKSAAQGRAGLPVGYDAPDFTLPALEGEQVALTSLIGRGKPVLMVFMSPWCGPCASLMPRIHQWQQGLSERLTLAVISMGTAEQNAAFEEQGIADVLLAQGMEIADMFGIAGTPSAVFVSRDGKIASHPAVTEFGIEPLVRLALRDGVSPSMEGSVA
jgi:thiol-disulfide isomerase/thioredoxin